jgi:hypothetical protein
MAYLGEGGMRKVRKRKKQQQQQQQQQQHNRTLQIKSQYITNKKVRKCNQIKWRSCKYCYKKNINCDNIDVTFANISNCIELTKEWELYKWIHNNLVIVDSKCASILQVASIILTVLAIIYSFIIGAGEPTTTVWVIKIVLLIPLFLLTWTILSLIKILYIYWNHPNDYLDISETIKMLFKLRNKRSLIIRLSVIRSGISLVVIVLILAVFLFIR